MASRDRKGAACLEKAAPLRSRLVDMETDMLGKLYLLLGTGLLGLYTTSAFMGWEIGSPGRETAQQAQARHATGGHRALWISSYRGGK